MKRSLMKNSMKGVLDGQNGIKGIKGKEKKMTKMKNGTVQKATGTGQKV